MRKLAGLATLVAFAVMSASAWAASPWDWDTALEGAWDGTGVVTPAGQDAINKAATSATSMWGASSLEAVANAYGVFFDDVDVAGDPLWSYGWTDGAGDWVINSAGTGWYDDGTGFGAGSLLVEDPYFASNAAANPVYAMAAMNLYAAEYGVSDLGWAATDADWDYLNAVMVDAYLLQGGTYINSISGIMENSKALTKLTVNHSSDVRHAKQAYGSSAAFAAAAAECQNGWRVWATPFGQWISRKVDNNKPFGYTLDSYGGVVGIEKYAGNWTFGLSVGYVWSKQKDRWAGPAFANNRSETKSDGLGATLYASWNATENFFVDAAFGYTYYWMDTDVNTSLINLSADSHKAYTFNSYVGAGYRFAIGNIALTPSVGLQWIYAKARGASLYNAGGVAITNIDKFHQNSLSLPLWLKAEFDWQTGNTLLKPYARIGWRHEFKDSAPWANISGGGLPYAMPGTVPGVEDVAMFGLGVNAQINDRWDVFAAWDIEWKSKYTNNMANIGFGYKF